MWGYQAHFRASLQIRAEWTFGKLDPGFEVEVFLLGLLRGEDKTLHPVCLEPEECGFSPSDFLSVRADVASYLALDGERNLISTTEAGDDAIRGRRNFRAVRAAVLKALQGGFERRDRSYFFSGFAPVDQYDVGVVLSLKHKDGLEGYRLPKSHADDRFRVPLSIVEAVAEEFLQGCLESLHVPQPTLVTDWRGHREEEILRQAANRLMELPNFAAGSFEGLYGLFSACNFISSLTYEGGESVGSMIVAPAEHPNVRSTLQLVNPVRLQKYRATRKLLEIATRGDSIISDGAHVTGFGKMVGNYDQARSDLFLIRFSGHHQWELLHGDHLMMRVRQELPRLAVPPINRADFFSRFKVLIPDLSRVKVGSLFDLALSACSQRSGTILVITPSAKDEARRLAAQGTMIVPTVASSSMLDSVTSIDGAVLLDVDGVCHAIGVILDGLAVENGDSGRGARYNSTLRYIAAMREKGIACIGIVVSEDGTAEIMPRLPRQISRDLVVQKESEMDQMLGTSFDLEKGFGLIKWLDENRFYLSEIACDKANRFCVKHNEELWKDRGMQIHRVEFKRDPEMSDAFFAETP
ncbi:hypothetical protein ACFQ5Q_14010 [Luteolibacter ambystomatis]